MPLSEQVEESLRDAQSNMRNALAFSARGEKTYVSKHIADMLHRIDNLIDVSDVLEKLENRKPGDSGTWGPFVDERDDEDC
jgi:hypothetical protein|tara:strand:- start:184 stop:426 length:243 start_codon:yes stop_codon:yes gene_type:complete